MNGNIKPEPPKIIVNLVWFKNNWRTHWKIIVVAILIILLAANYQRVFSFAENYFKGDTVEDILGRP